LNFTPLNNLVTYQDKQKGNMPNEQR
jgi:hypothetical protein